MLSLVCLVKLQSIYTWLPLIVGLTTVTTTREPTVLNSADFIFLPVKLLDNSPVLFPEAQSPPIVLWHS